MFRDSKKVDGDLGERRSAPGISGSGDCGLFPLFGSGLPLDARGHSAGSGSTVDCTAGRPNGGERAVGFFAM